MDEETNANGGVVGNYVSVYHAIDSLNKALKIDPECVKTLFTLQIPCNFGLACSRVEAYSVDGQYLTNVLGLINSIFSYHNDGRSYRILPVYEKGVLTEFRLGISYGGNDKPDIGG